MNDDRAPLITVHESLVNTDCTKVKVLDDPCCRADRASMNRAYSQVAMQRDIWIAAAQFEARDADKDYNFGRIEALARQAVAAGGRDRQLPRVLDHAATRSCRRSRRDELARPGRAGARRPEHAAADRAGPAAQACRCWPG